MVLFLQISFNNLYSFHIAFLKVINTLDINNIELNMSFHVEAVYRITDTGTLSGIWPGIITNLSSHEFVLVTHSAHYENYLPRIKIAYILFPAVPWYSTTYRGANFVFIVHVIEREGYKMGFSGQIDYVRAEQSLNFYVILI